MSTTSQTTKQKFEREVKIGAGRSAADVLAKAAEEATFLEAAGYVIEHVHYWRHEPIFDKTRPVTYNITLVAEKERP